MKLLIEHHVHYQKGDSMQFRKQPRRSLSARSTLIGLCVLIGGLAHAQDTGHSDLHVNVQGLQNSQGQVVANLFHEGEDVFGKPHLKQTQFIVERRAQLTFANLANGRYALIVFHDVNGNNDLDHNFLRLPAEPLGFSNGFELSLLSGMPSFRKLAFTAGPDSKTIDIAVR
nr:DUF2141 domain-containing protein [Rhodoferax sp.]